MIGKTNAHFLTEFYSILCNAFDYHVVEPHTDNLLKFLLENNGCAFADNWSMSNVELKSIPDYNIYFLYKAKANDVNEFYDYIELMGTKNLIIFMDYFDGLMVNKKSESEIDDELDKLMGRSVYFDAIKRITDVFICTNTVVLSINMLSSTSAANAYRFAGTFIAAKILERYGELTENDISIISLEDLKRMLNEIPLNLLLLGAKYK